MLFLLNSVVFDLDEACPAPSHDLRRFASLDIDAIVALACDLFSEDPHLPQSDPVRARRLAWLIAHRCEGINAALFWAPMAGCNPLMVEPRFCTLPASVLDQLKASTVRHPRTGELYSPADQMVWNLVAA